MRDDEAHGHVDESSEHDEVEEEVGGGGQVGAQDGDELDGAVLEDGVDLEQSERSVGGRRSSQEFKFRMNY